jgi:hypothetical protein
MGHPLSAEEVKGAVNTAALYHNGPTTTGPTHPQNAQIMGYPP